MVRQYQKNPPSEFQPTFLAHTQLFEANPAECDLNINLDFPNIFPPTSATKKYFPSDNWINDTKSPQVNDIEW